jgi:hypothetical protein
MVGPDRPWAKVFRVGFWSAWPEKCTGIMVGLFGLCLREPFQIRGDPNFWLRFSPPWAGQRIGYKGLLGLCLLEPCQIEASQIFGGSAIGSVCPVSDGLVPLWRHSGRVSIARLLLQNRRSASNARSLPSVQRSHNPPLVLCSTGRRFSLANRRSRASLLRI